MARETLSTYRSWWRRELALDIYDGGDFEFGSVDLFSHEGKECTFCRSSLVFRNAGSEFVNSHHFSLECWVCGWWKLVRIIRTGLPIETAYVAVGDVKHFNVDELNVPLGEMRSFLVKHPDYLTDIHTTVFERLMRDCLRSVYPGAKVHHVGRVSDGGVDIKLIAANGDVYLVQVKRRTNTAMSESVTAVRELNGVLFREGIAKGMVISTASSFTRAAVSETYINTPTQERYEMKLIPLHEVMDMLRISGPFAASPWKHLMKLDEADFGAAGGVLPMEDHV